jgi:uncharacterized protein YbjT (DUF2867 family)
MKILSLGANGAVGQLALDDLLNANHEVTALVRNASSMNRNTRSSGRTHERGRPGKGPRSTGHSDLHSPRSHE